MNTGMLADHVQASAQRTRANVNPPCLGQAITTCVAGLAV